MKHQYKTLFLDMDGVLSDFDSHVRHLLGKSLHDFNTSQEGWDAVQPYKDTFFTDMLPLPDAHSLVQEVLDLAGDYGFHIAVLTAIPKIGRMPSARLQKHCWINKYFPEFSGSFNIGPHAEHKQFHCIAGDILIDDSIMNIDQWQAVGGIGIYHTSAIESISMLEKHLKTCT